MAIPKISKEAFDLERLRKKLQRQGALLLRNEAYFAVRRSDDGEVQRSIWAFSGAANGQ